MIDMKLLDKMNKLQNKRDELFAKRYKITLEHIKLTNRIDDLDRQIREIQDELGIDRKIEYRNE